MPLEQLKSASTAAGGAFSPFFLDRLLGVPLRSSWDIDMDRRENPCHPRSEAAAARGSSLGDTVPCRSAASVGAAGL